MMRMQPEAEGYSDQVSCGGAARRLDVSALSELRNRVAGAHDALDDASSAGARTANAPSFATAAAMSAEAVAEDDGLDARRRILRRRVLWRLRPRPRSSRLHAGNIFRGSWHGLQTLRRFGRSSPTTA